MFDVIAFDADDTLWHNETLYLTTQEKLKRLLERYHRAEWLEGQLYQTELRNLQYFGYGIKGFTLSMIETAIELTEGRITGSEVQEVIDFAKEMLHAEIQLLEYAEETVARLSVSHTLMIITKGDLFDQEIKIARSGLAHYFKHIEIVSEKTSDSYKALLAQHHIEPQRFLMVGNSLKSDILPILGLGGQAVYIPYQLTWAYESVSHPETTAEGYYQLEHLGLLPALVERLSNR